MGKFFSGRLRWLTHVTVLFLLSSLCQGFDFLPLPGPEEFFEMLSGMGDFFRPSQSFLTFREWQPEFDVSKSKLGDVETQEAYFGSEIMSSYFCGKDHSGMLVHTTNRRLHILMHNVSGTGSQTLDWVELGARLSELNIVQPGRTNSSSIKVRSPIPLDILAVFQNPYFSEMFIIKEAQSNALMVTPDCGQTFKLLTAITKRPQVVTKSATKQGDPDVVEIKFNPLFKDWLLVALKWQPSQSGSRLYMSKDYADWQEISQSVVAFDWVANYANLRSGTPQDGIVVLRRNIKGAKNNNQAIRYSRVHKNVNLLELITGGGRRKTTLVEFCFKYYLTDHFLYASQIMGTWDDPRMLVKVGQLAKDIVMKEAKMPQRSNPRMISFFEFDGSVVFANFESDDLVQKGLESGELYIADSTGSRLSLSLENHAISTKGQMTDIIKVDSIEGIFLVNVRDEKIVNLYREKKRSNQNTPGKLSKNEDANLEDYKRTLISFNNGGSWRPLSPPSFDASGRPLSCIGCSLHLFIDSTHLIQGAVAPKTALGLIVAHGNVGNSLSHLNIGVYVSSDGGISWNHARDGLHRMALGNHGGIVLLADASKPTRTLLYSYDHGKKFDSVTFSPEGQEVTVTSLKSDHSNPGSIKFFLSGLKHTQNGVKGVALIIDFAHSNLPECRLIEKPGTKHSDYEYFEIRPTNSSECTLGSKHTYVKKRPTANCRVNNSDGFIALTQRCKCTWEDWICELDFERDPKSKECLPVHPKNTHHDGALGAKECHFLHYQTQGYRKITGSKCSGGVDLGPVVQPCPLNPNHKLVIVSLFAALVCISAATIWSFKRVLILVYLMTFNRYKPAASQDGNTSYSSELPLSQEEEQEYILGSSNSRGGHTSAQDVSRGKSKRLKAD